jgi:hypothetical protein
METRERSGFLTKKEFYTSQITVWLYLTIVIGIITQTNDNPLDTVLWVAALGMMLVYAFFAFRSK